MRRLLVSLIFISLCGQAFAANFNLEIIQPQAGLTTTNRFYKAYPGLEYNVRLAVIGGAYPYTHTINEPATTCNDNGQAITLNSSTGELYWTPQVGDTGCTMSVTVTDQESSTDSVVWTVTVTTTGFIFVDANNGAHGAAGDIEHPLLSMSDVYGGTDYASKSSVVWSGCFVYWKTGTYAPQGYDDADGYLYFQSDNKPVVWLAYPGDSPVIDYNFIADLRMAFLNNSANTVYMDGLEVKNIAVKGFHIHAYPQQGAVFRNMHFHNLVSEATTCSNQAFINFERSDSPGDGFVIQDSIMETIRHGAALKFYTTNKSLIEDNYITDISEQASYSCYSAEGVALKEEILRATVRHNRFYNATTGAIGGNMNLYDGAITQNNEICFNRLWGNSAIYINEDGNAGEQFYYRNTSEGSFNIANANTGPFRIYNNVIQAASPQISGNLTNVVDTNNLTGTSGLVETDGTLVNRTYVGTYGWEITGAVASGSTMGGTGACSQGGTGAMVMQ